jgi:hypothetical protein
MTSSFVFLRRIVALSVAIALFIVPIASAQSPEAVPAVAAPANTALLSPAAFARLVQRSPADAVPAPVVNAPPRLDLLRQATAAMTREAQATATAVPKQRSWVARHKTITAILIGVGAFFGGIGIFCAATGCED